MYQTLVDSLQSRQTHPQAKAELLSLAASGRCSAGCGGAAPYAYPRSSVHGTLLIFSTNHANAKT